jgi:HK97 family phage prohead protease
MTNRFMLAAVLAAPFAVLTRDPNVDEDERRQPMAGFQGTRGTADDLHARFAADSYDAATRTVEAVLSAGSPVKRFFFTEELEISAEAIDLGRAVSGLVPLLDAHNQRNIAAVIGSISNVRIENGELLGTLTFGETDEARAAEGMVARKELKGISIGYRVNTWTIVSQEDGHETWRATRWELLEVSLVPVPADANAGVRSNNSGQTPGNGATAAPTQKDEEDMRRNLPGGASAAAIAAATAASAPAAGTEADRGAPAGDAPAAAPAAAAPAAAAPAAPTVARFSGADAVAFVDQARALGVETRATELVQQNERGEIGIETARSALLTAAAEAQRAATAPVRGGATVQVTRDADETSRAAIADAIFARATRSDPSEAARQYMGMSLLDVARARAGLPSSERDVQVILRAANTTSDFPLLLEAAANKVLLGAYGRAAPTYRAIAKQRNLTDFKATKLLRVGDFPTLLAYQEDGEIKAGTINEGRETVILGSFGRILRLSRQAIINDDLGAFDDVLGSIGGMVSRFENSSFYAMKAVNSGNGPKLADNVNLFNAGRGNLAGSGGAVDVTTLGAGRAAMRKQTDPDGQPLNIAPAIILSGPDTETAIEQFLAPIVAADNTKVNPFSSKLQQITEASVTGNSWELYADPNDYPVFHYGYLESAPGPRVMTHEPFNTDGLAFRVTLDFYSGATDYRGAYRNPGA